MDGTIDDYIGTEIIILDCGFVLSVKIFLGSAASYFTNFFKQFTKFNSSFRGHEILDDHQCIKYYDIGRFGGFFGVGYKIEEPSSVASLHGFQEIRYIFVHTENYIYTRTAEIGIRVGHEIIK